ncbi:MAG TPA: dTDP-4-dehydrorhamnose 3,5-epimerase family protein [Pyrinomonadaceae bacterium]
MQAKSLPTPDRFTIADISGVLVRDLQKFQDERGWLAELFRQDTMPEEFYPAMAYVSLTEPGVTRGPHEHVYQADFFCFLGPSNFKLRMWDQRRESKTFNNVMTLTVGIDNPKSVLVPVGVVHAYRNIGNTPGMVINCPNRLYRGKGGNEKIDEIRHEDDPNTVFRMDD